MTCNDETNSVLLNFSLHSFDKLLKVLISSKGDLKGNIISSLLYK